MPIQESSFVGRSSSNMHQQHVVLVFLAYAVWMLLKLEGNQNWDGRT